MLGHLSNSQDHCNRRVEKYMEGWSGIETKRRALKSWSSHPKNWQLVVNPFVLSLACTHPRHPYNLGCLDERVDISWDAIMSHGHMFTGCDAHHSNSEDIGGYCSQYMLLGIFYFASQTDPLSGCSLAPPIFCRIKVSRQAFPANSSSLSMLSGEI